ncbi:CDP-diacylglycerol pyrophosphatase [Chromobacterium violaceum]|uniref:CDP-diacylglycerol pyrophosphatase n=1 Tax=Chromobacterium violaceum TaxID=536 RepID=A0A3S4HVE8_CHRVL|nr:CDP-diacylglycerol pyrophosphatase [Chromobacterium violaceum]
MPAQQGQGLPGPCAEVKLQQGVAVLKDRNGPLQYLLIPTDKVSGIESPRLLGDDVPAYWRAAWQARRYLDARRGQPLPRLALSLAINSEYGRSQNQLHIHISCTDPTVRQQVDDLADGLKRRWRQLPVELKGHAYWARRVDADQNGDPLDDPSACWPMNCRARAPRWDATAWRCCRRASPTARASCCWPPGPICSKSTAARPRSCRTTIAGF